MRILLVTATASEVQFSENHQFFNQNDAEILITGAGMVPTAYSLGEHLAVNKFDLAINAGICGSFNEAFSPGTVVNVTEDFFPEAGAEDDDDFLDIFRIGLADPGRKPYSGGMLKSFGFPSVTSVKQLPVVRGVTVNTVHGNTVSIEKFRNRWSADTESMEGAAFLYACIMNDLPCIQIRGISNKVEKRDKSSWEIEKAITNLNHVLFNILTELR